MGIINRLSAHVANCIAAGEVVERPASVVKELLENCIDAGATVISVEIRGGGIDEIIVADDGCGMSPDDARACFLRHATSKISSEEDLEGIATLGFRGEALAAISAVSRIELTTRPRDQELGTRLYLEAGEIQENEECACAAGTVFHISNLFFNTPARMKFLRSVKAEGMHVASVVTKLALSHPEVRITFVRDGKEVIATSGDGDLQAAVYSVCGRDFAGTLEQITGSPSSNVHVWGFVTRPECARSSRNMQYMFLNGRSIQSRTVMAALEEAYRGFSTTGKFPGCVLHLALDPMLVDANVHPAKLEVKFADEHAIFEAVYYAVRAALQKATARPEFHLKNESPFLDEAPEKTSEKPETTAAAGTEHEKASDEQTTAPLGKIGSFSEQSERVEYPVISRHQKPHNTMDAMTIWEHLREGSRTPPPIPLRPTEEPALFERVPVLRREEPQKKAVIVDADIPEEESVPSKLPEPAKSAGEPVQEAIPEEIIPESAQESGTDTDLIPETPETAVREPQFRVLGELFGAYIVAECENEAIIIDKHAAHERIRFEQLLREQELGSAPAVQTLLTPVVLSLEPAEAAAVAENEELLRSYGVTAENFGGHDLVIRELPEDVDPDHAAALVTELAHALRHTSHAQLREAILHRMACHSAIRGGEYTTMAEMEALTRIVLTTPTLKHCPHGRPVAMIMSKQDFIRNFER
ncbi:MAG: DNA mismatch repair endonuclease MutL [Ruminococcaceae bacterium]|nr:DNA mismatch repair endonuclease MutL [Oscillospiraceae bacterium]